MEATWRPILTRYQHGQTTAKSIYKDMLKTFEDVVKSKVLGEGITIEKLVTDAEKETIEKCLVIKPTIAFIGQVNAGKSSLANELLGGGTWVPVAPEPCTSRMVRLKYSKEPYKQKIPFHGEPEKRSRLKDKRPTPNDIRLKDEEKKDPKVFEVEVLFGVPNPYLHPNLEVVDLPGWCEKEELNAVIVNAVDRISQSALIPVYVLDGNLTVTAVDRELIRLLTEKLKGKQLLFVCNKIDHVEEELEHDHGKGGRLEVFDDGTARYTVEDRETKLLNKKEATFESLKKFGLVNDSETASSSSSFYAVSAKISKATRTNEQTVQSKYCDHQYNEFCRNLNSILDRVLTSHVLGIVRSTTAAVSRFAEGTLTARSAELSSDLQLHEILHRAGRAEQDAYSKCIEFLSKEKEAIEAAVLEAFGAARQTILKNARAMTSKDFEGDAAKAPPAMAFVATIAEMSARVLHSKITAKIEEVKEKYVEHMSFLLLVVVGGCSALLSGLFQSIYHPDDSDFLSTLQNIERDETMQAAVGLFMLIPEAVHLALKQVVPGEDLISGKIFTKMTGAALGIVKLDEKWKESIAQEFLSIVDVKALATAILKHFSQKLEARHANFVQSHKRMIELREAASKRSKEDNMLLRKEFTPRVAMLLLRLYALQCVFEKGEPQEGEKLAEGNHSSVFSCIGWGGLQTTDNLVVKRSFPLPQTDWKQVAESFYVLRTIQGNDNVYKHIVKLHCVLISPLDAKEGEQRLVLVLEKRARTLPVALRQGLSRDERKLIAFDLAQALSFLHSEDILHGNLTSDAASLDSQNRAKIDLMKLSTSLFENSWLGCPAFHQPPEVFVNEDATSSVTDVYSFGMILWELFNESTQPPPCYADCNSKEDIKRKVCDESLRPSKPDYLQDEWYSIMQDCWKEPGDRPSMEDLSSRIKELVFSTGSQAEEGYSSD